ncbi:MAG: xanthine dehydrogenase family protein subunit M [Bacteroidota bacterium]
MIPQTFEYASPSTLSEAIELLVKHGDEAKILSGGHSLLPMMKLRLAEPEMIIDINNIPDMSYIRESDGYLRLGALTREVDLEDSELLRSRYPIFADVTKLIADPQVRNWGTIGGNLAHGDAANDHPAVMLAMNAEVVSVGPNGEKVTHITDFFHGFYMTALEEDEILTEIRIPIPAAGSGSAYTKLERKVGDYATAGVAVQLTLDAAGNCTYIGIGLTNVGAKPIKVTRAEELLKGTNLSQDLIDQAAQIASEDCSPSADLRGSEEYKRAMVKVLVRRMMKLAIERAKAN